MVGDDLFSCDRLTALVFEGELALLGLAALSFITLCCLLECVTKMYLESVSTMARVPFLGGVVKVVWELATTSVLTLQLV